MRTPLYQPLCAALAVLLAGCGYVGEPLPPALNIPIKITDLKAVEHGDKIAIAFTVSDKTTEDLILKKRGDVELFVNSERIPVPRDKFGEIKVETPAKPFIGQEVTVRARVLNARGRRSDWSNDVKFMVVEPLAVPGNLKAENVDAGVLLQWEARGAGAFRVFRNGESAGTADKAEWVDSSTEYGKKYEYSVQAVSGGAESGIAGPVSITPVDIFPPKTPANLQAIVGSGSIELAWDRDTEPDLAGYRLYKAVNGGELQLTGDLITTPSFSDKNVQAGKKYSYAISAIDQKGNESAKSAVVEAALP